MEFPVQRDLLNPMFEGYKLDPIPQEEVVSRFDLPSTLSQGIVSKSPLSFPEVQSRIYHNHLTVSHGRAAYVDGESKVVLVELNEDALEPRFTTVYELPQSVTSASAASLMHVEFPVALLASPDVLLVSDGHGSLHVLRVDAHAPSQASALYKLSTVDADTHPFRLHEAALTPDGDIFAILSFRCYDSATGSSVVEKRHPPKFEVWGVKIGQTSSSGEPQAITPVFRRRGDSVPAYVRCDPSHQSYLIAGGCVYRPLEAPPAPSYTPSPDEMAPIPRADENLDDSPADPDTPPRPPPYSWYQTPDALTVVFALPSSTNTRDIRVAFTTTTLTLSVRNVADTTLPIPTYTSQRLWDTIRPDTTYWTWDRAGERTCGLLTLTLDKAEEGRNWMHVFASAEHASGGLRREDAEVPETRDPSELAGIRDSLEKYTTALGGEGGGLGHGVPSLGEGEMDMEIDSTVGREVCVTWVKVDGAEDVSSTPVQLLSTDIPSDNDHASSFVLKNGLDGTAFSLSADGPNGPQWTHTGTFPALSFVLASKQDTRFVYHVPGRAVMAFEGGTNDRGSNVYLYRATEGKALWSKQAILKIAEGTSGSLLGVGFVNHSKHGPVIVCLAEKQLIVLKHVL